ncbi:hypothetical protein BDP27DRAFT_1350433, partial [Rhodocollybia butyracea]
MDDGNVCTIGLAKFSLQAAPKALVSLKRDTMLIAPHPTQSKTPSGIPHREITTIYKGLNKEKVGSIEIHNYREQNISLTTSFTGTSGELTASDGQAYKWAWKQPAIELLAHDGSETLVARCDQAHILVYPQALHIVEEVLVTLFYMLQTTKRDDIHGPQIIAIGGEGGGNIFP